MFGINGAEFLVLIGVALLVIGPERLPAYAEQLAASVRTLKAFVRSAKARVEEELGEEAKEVDWASLDPRQYDPRRIIQEALKEELSPGDGRSAAASARRTSPTHLRPPAASRSADPVVPSRPSSEGGG